MKTFRITVSNFEKHNPNRKAAYKKVLITNNIFNDSKVSSLRATEKLLFIFLITQAGDQGSSTVALNERQISFAVGPGQRPESLLESLQCFQLVTFEVSDSLIKEKRIEEKRKEEKRKERKGSEREASPSTPPPNQTSLLPEIVEDPKPVVLGAHDLIAHYCECWKKSYKSEKSPPISGRDAKAFSLLIKDFGYERAKILITAFLRMPDPWFIKKRHDIGTLSGNLNAVALFADSGKMISNKEIKDLDKKVGDQNLVDALERGEI